MWVELVVGLRPCSEVFLWVFPFPPSTKTNAAKFQLDPEQWNKRHSVEVSLQIHIYSVLFIYLILYSKIQMDPVVTLKLFQAIEKQTLLSVRCSDHFIHNFLNLLEGKALSLRSCKNIRYLWLYSTVSLVNAK